MASSRDDQFAELFAANQQRIFGYVLGIVRNGADANDIVQQTAITLWNKFDEFELGTDFVKWAITVARFETMNFLRCRRRNRVYFDHALIEQLASDFASAPSEVLESRRAALKYCLSKLKKEDSKLIQVRYSHGLGSRQISELLDRSQASICNSLRRIREALLECVKSADARGAI